MLALMPRSPVTRQRIGFAIGRFGVALAILAFPYMAAAAAIDDVKIEVGNQPCKGFGTNDRSFVVYATNTNPQRSVDAAFKYDSVPAQQHFILFDANLNPTTDRFPKFHARRLAPRETAPIGCTYTFRAAPRPPGPLSVALVITKQSASYLEANAPVPPPEDAREFAMFYLQGGIDDCPQGARPPGLFYLVNLHPFAQLSAAINPSDDHDLAPLSTMRIGCSNGASKAGPITSAALEATAGAGAIEALAAPAPAAPPLPAPVAPPLPAPVASPSPAPAAASASAPLAPLSLGDILQTQIVCAGSTPPGWIKINDGWNPTVCGNPAAITYNVWTLQQFTDQPPGAVIHACKGYVPSGWAVVGTGWNPTVCGHPSTSLPNVMAIKRLN
jgi:hypothetical protein